MVVLFNTRDKHIAFIYIKVLPLLSIEEDSLILPIFPSVRRVDTRADPDGEPLGSFFEVPLLIRFRSHDRLNNR